MNPNFYPITRPTRGDTIRVSTVYTIEWDTSTQGHSGPINILLQNVESSDFTDYSQLISSMKISPTPPGVISTTIQISSANTKSSDGKFKWNVSSTLPTDKYYIKIDYINNVSVFNESPIFEIKGSNDSTHSISATPTVISAESTTTALTSLNSLATQSASTITSTSSGAGSTMTPMVAAQFAWMGAAAVGKLFFFY